jgi:hypothetical protein
MIEAPRHWIDLGGGRIRVLRLVGQGGHTYPLRYTARTGPGCCRACACTDRYGCPGGCGWTDKAHTLCSRCLERLLA